MTIDRSCRRGIVSELRISSLGVKNDDIPVRFDGTKRMSNITYAAARSNRAEDGDIDVFKVKDADTLPVSDGDSDIVSDKASKGEDVGDSNGVFEGDAPNERDDVGD